MSINSAINDWYDSPLSALGELSRGKSKHRPRNYPALFGGEYPFIQTGDVKHSNFYVNSFDETYNEIGLKQSKLWPKDTLCITIAANIAETAVLKFPACFPDSIVGFIENPEKSDFRFIKYALDYYKKRYQERSKGAAQDNLSLEKIESLKLRIPKVELQRQIADIIFNYDRLIENNEKRIKILEEMAQRLYEEWFVKFKFPGHEKVKMVDSGTEIGLIPEGWDVKKLGDIAREKRDPVNPKNIDAETPYVGLEHLPRKSLVLIDWGKASHVGSTKHIFRKGNIIFGKIRPYFHKVVVAPLNGVTSTDSIVIEPLDDKCFGLVVMYVSSEKFIEFATTTSQGTKMPRAEWKILTQYPVCIPDIETREKFNMLITDIINQANKLMMINRDLKSIRDLLIPQLVTGKRELKI